MYKVTACFRHAFAYHSSLEVEQYIHKSIIFSKYCAVALGPGLNQRAIKLHVGCLLAVLPVARSHTLTLSRIFYYIFRHF